MRVSRTVAALLVGLASGTDFIDSPVAAEGREVGPVPRGGYHHHHRPPLYLPFPYPVPYPIYPPIPEVVVIQSAPRVILPRPSSSGPAARPTLPKTRPVDTALAAEMLTLGDRLFRAKNYGRAVERLKESIEADPTKAAPYVRLAQIDVARGKYSEAASHFREAQTVEPGWLVNAPDIQSIYLEPTDFTRALSQLETHLQAHPTDRDAWFVLGAQLYLSGRTRRAADVFLRLSDRRADAALSAFLDATRPRDVEPAR